jgi:hypothetical protein
VAAQSAKAPIGREPPAIQRAAHPVEPHVARVQSPHVARADETGSGSPQAASGHSPRNGGDRAAEGDLHLLLRELTEVEPVLARSGTAGLTGRLANCA